MAKKKWRSLDMVYSTHEASNEEDNVTDKKTLANAKQFLEAHLEKKHRGGKTAVIIKGYNGATDNLKDLAKWLKQKCGVGGSVKDGQIIIQGNVRDKVMELLKNEGYNVKRVGG